MLNLWHDQPQTVENIMRTTIATVLISVFLVAACNTMQGVGKDIETVGEKMQGSAENAKKK